jgi:peptidoglycan/xylan/chitin deacetylase (PgdA/CDA1 family)/folate-dependent phosphoribosylglycinamide formyltransferase PurN
VSERLRLVVLTADPLSPVDRVFFERLARDPALDLRAVVVDGYVRPRAPLWRKVRRSVEQDGWGWLWFRAVTKATAAADGAARWLFDRAHLPRRVETFETLARDTGIAVHRVADVHGDDSLALIRSLRPQLGLIVGGRILRDAVVSIPEYGTLNIHKRKVPDYRGGGPVGYWELLAGEKSIGVTIHYATAKVDEGDVVAEATIPIEECDTLASLRIKADLTGARLYHEAVRAIAGGRREGTRQDLQQGRTYRAPSEMRVWRLERRLRKNAARRMPALQQRPSGLTWARVALQYALLSPLLLRWRRRLTAKRQSPVCILFYHLVANRPLNHMCLPLEEFVRQMEFLRRYHPLLSLAQAAERVARGESDEVAVSVTFDDGYHDNAWAIEYLRQLGIPACFFVSIAHVLDGRPFEHDRRRGFADARPLTATDLQAIAAAGFEVGSHGLHHEDFGTLDADEAERVLSESRRLIAEVTGSVPVHFSFPKGQPGTNITAESFAAASRHYRHLYSAYGGYNIPGQQSGPHLRRVGNPAGLLDLAALLDGYTGLRQCLRGNAWGFKTSALAPCGPGEVRARALVAESGR